MAGEGVDSDPPGRPCTRAMPDQSRSVLAISEPCHPSHALIKSNGQMHVPGEHWSNGSQTGKLVHYWSIVG